MTLKGIIFDMDGSIVDNIPYHREAWLTFLQRYDILLSPADFSAQNHGTIHEMISRFFPLETDAQKIVDLGQEKEKTYRDIYQPHLKQVAGLVEFLQWLDSKQVTAHLATMGDPPNIEFTLDGLGIAPHFATVTGGHEVSKGKPAPEIFLRALAKSQLNKHECLAIEDSAGGVKSALAAGLTCIGMTTSSTPQELKDLGCLTAVSDFYELRDFIELHY